MATYRTHNIGGNLEKLGKERNRHGLHVIGPVIGELDDHVINQQRTHYSHYSHYDV